MTRWLKILRAEFTRDVTMSLRYPLELGSGLIVMYVLFMGIFTGSRSIMHGAALPEGNVQQLIVGFCMWFLALIALNSVSIDIENEARQGTLEQLLLCAPNLPGLIWLRAVVHTMLGSLTVLAMSLLLQLSTGHWFKWSLPALLLAVPIVMFTLIGLQGLGMVLGGLSLLYKRIGQFSSMIQFAFFFPAVVDLSGTQGIWHFLTQHMPLQSGSVMLKELFASSGVSAAVLARLPALGLDSAIYAASGTLLFVALYKRALKRGTVAHY